MILNEEYSFNDVRYLISSKSGEKMPHTRADGSRPSGTSHRPISYDAGGAFVGYPEKVLLAPGTVLDRLDFQANFSLFTNVWWMKNEALESLLLGGNHNAASLRHEWQDAAALPKPSRGVRTWIVEIVLTEQVYAWAGKASALFHRPGGVEQIYLPNLARGTGANRSDFARLKTTYTLAAP